MRSLSRHPRAGALLLAGHRQTSSSVMTLDSPCDNLSARASQAYGRAASFRDRTAISPGSEGALRCQARREGRSGPGRTRAVWVDEFYDTWPILAHRPVRDRGRCRRRLSFVQAEHRARDGRDLCVRARLRGRRCVPRAAKEPDHQDALAGRSAGGAADGFVGAAGASVALFAWLTKRVTPSSDAPVGQADDR